MSTVPPTNPDPGVKGDHRRVLAHVCTYDGCDAIELDRSCNHSQYMCYHLDAHPLPQPMRPLYLVADEVQPDLDEARRLRDRASGGGWTRPSEHFENGHCTEPLGGEDWLGWPDATVPSEDQPTWRDDDEQFQREWERDYGVAPVTQADVLRARERVAS